MFVCMYISAQAGNSRRGISFIMVTITDIIIELLRKAGNNGKLGFEFASTWHWAGLHFKSFMSTDIAKSFIAILISDADCSR